MVGHLVVEIEVTEPAIGGTRPERVPAVGPGLLASPDEGIFPIPDHQTGNSGKARLAVHGGVPRPSPGIVRLRTGEGPATGCCEQSMNASCRSRGRRTDVCPRRASTAVSGLSFGIGVNCARRHPRPAIFYAREGGLTGQVPVFCAGLSS